MKRILIAFLLIISGIVSSQEKLLFIDSETKEPITFATIAFGDGLGGYTNENGEFTFDKKQNFSISFIGYKTLNVSENDFKNTIELQNEPIQIQEVIISNKKGKQKIVKQKQYWKNSTWLDSFTPQIGNEIAVLIPNEKKQDIVLSKISIPIATNPMRIFDKKSKEHFKSRDEYPYTIIRIRFYENQNNQPGDLFYSDEVVVNIHNSKEKYHEINLEEYNIDVPENGLFVGIEFLGVTDSNQKYVYRPNFYEVERNGVKVRTAVHVNICIPIDQKSKKQITFIRYSDWNKNGEKFAWKVFTEEIFLKLNEDRENSKGFANIGLGYEFKIYE